VPRPVPHRPAALHGAEHRHMPGQPHCLTRKRLNRPPRAGRGGAHKDVFREGA
jgi:hypothetical protein